MTIFSFVNYYKSKGNLYGENIFDYYKNETIYDPPLKFKLAKYF